MIISDGTASNKQWRCKTLSFGPTDASNAAGCSKTNLGACKLDVTPEPADWFGVGFDDSQWEFATEYSDDAVGWGVTPTFADGKCGPMTDPLTRDALSPSTKETKADEVRMQHTPVPVYIRPYTIVSLVSG